MSGRHDHHDHDHHHDHHDCLKFFERLSELLDGELDQMTGDKIEAHLTSCPECRTCWATFKKTVEVYQHLGPASVPEGFLEKLKQTVMDYQKETGEPKC